MVKILDPPSPRMPLVDTPENPIPPGAIVETLRAIDGVGLRAARWTPATATRGTVAIFGGRAEFIEKYFETIGDLLDRSFAVAMLDWRGQGGSERQLRNPRKGHIDDFSLYERDLAAFVNAGRSSRHCPRPWFGALPFHGRGDPADDRPRGRCPFERLVLTSPMIAIANLKRPKLARGLIEALDALGLGGAFTPGGGATPIGLAPFEGNPLTSDPVRYARIASTLKPTRRSALGWPTIGWMHAAFRLMRQFEDPISRARSSTPALVFAAGADRVTDTRACERFAERLRAGRLIVVDGAEHEILIERDLFRDAVLGRVRRLHPGLEAERIAART